MDNRMKRIMETTKKEQRLLDVPFLQDTNEFFKDLRGLILAYGDRYNRCKTLLAARGGLPSEAPTGVPE